GVIEQTLSLSCADKISLFNALQENNRQENRFYNYYFHTDNCTSRARDMIVQNTRSPIVFKSIIPSPPPTYRNLIHIYLDKAGQHWN
ncbi:lipoprotein N-acyltransferase Lnb domain-containing protein, partial [Rhizobium leguminosarum]|uniref:lipoprotein N-acyltransferase Lnb domain-containing protein n=1 Tax=Rhizobium leguminosarum TaxID=384 RepID=UPI003F9BE973